MPDALAGHLWYNIGGKVKGAHHDGHAYPSKKGKEKQIMSEKQETQTPKKTSSVDHNETYVALQKRA